MTTALARSMRTLTARSRCLLTMSATARALSSETSGTFRLRRPSRMTDFLQEDAGGHRAHAITLFPGDFSDDAENQWDDDDEDLVDDDDEKKDADYIITQRMREKFKALEEKEKLLKEKWMRNSIPPTYTPQIDERGRAYGRGGRKTASARVWIQPGLGEIVVNRRSFVDYFERLSDRELVLQPLVATETCGVFDVQVFVQGGGVTGQAGAVRHGLARALNAFNPDEYRPPLKRLGFLERDYRMVERKKIGRKKARKSPQWVRR